MVGSGYGSGSARLPVEKILAVVLQLCHPRVPTVWMFQLHCFALPVIHGFVSINSCSIYGHKFQWSLVSRFLLLLHVHTVQNINCGHTYRRFFVFVYSFLSFIQECVVRMYRYAKMWPPGKGNTVLIFVEGMISDRVRGPCCYFIGSRACFLFKCFTIIGGVGSVWGPGCLCVGPTWRGRWPTTWRLSRSWR
jgi:hypothetical protein